MAEACFEYILVVHWSEPGSTGHTIQIWSCNEQVASAKVLEEELCDKNEETLLQHATNSFVHPAAELRYLLFSEVEKDRTLLFMSIKWLITTK